MIDNWESELPGLSVEELRDRERLARKGERDADRGIGRNPKARQRWRKMREQVEEELERRRP